MIFSRVRSRAAGCPTHRAARPLHGGRAPAPPRARGVARRLALLVALAAFGALARPAARAQPIAVQITPVNTTRAVRPGAAVSGTIQVTNPTGARVHLSVFPTDFLMRPSGRITLLPVGSLPRSSAPWLQLSRQAITLAPGASADVRYTAAVPKDAAAGTHWSAIVFRSAGAAPNAAGGNAIGFRITVQDAFVIYLDVGTMKAGASIQSLSLDPAKRGPAAFHVVVQNGGNAVLHMHGRIEVRSLDGKLVHTYPIPLTASFPGSVRDRSVAVSPALKPGGYLLTCILRDGTSTVITGQTQVTVR